MVKGLVIGGAIGYGAYALGLDGGWNWLTYGVVGAFVGLLVGKPLWSLIMDKNSTTVVGALKAIFGFGVCVGLYALVAKAWGGFQVSIAGETRWVWAWQPIMGAAVGAVYGGFVELDDSLDDNAAKKKAPASGAPKQISAAPKKKA
jgi:Na+/proline symporter